MIQGESIEHDYIRNLKSQSCKQMSKDRIVLDLESEAAWVLFPPGVTFGHWIFFT